MKRTAVGVAATDVALTPLAVMAPVTAHHGHDPRPRTYELTGDVGGSKFDEQTATPPYEVDPLNPWRSGRS